MDPLFVHPVWDVLVEVLFAIIVLSFFVERSLSLVVVHRFDLLFAKDLTLKEPIALVASIFVATGHDTSRRTRRVAANARTFDPRVQCVSPFDRCQIWPDRAASLRVLFSRLTAKKLECGTQTPTAGRSAEVDMSPTNLHRSQPHGLQASQ
jgi:hypothetical protein